VGAARKVVHWASGACLATSVQPAVVFVVQRPLAIRCHPTAFCPSNLSRPLQLLRPWPLQLLLQLSRPPCSCLVSCLARRLLLFNCLSSLCRSTSRQKLCAPKFFGAKTTDEKRRDADVEERGQASRRPRKRKGRGKSVEKEEKASTEKDRTDAGREERRRSGSGKQKVEGKCREGQSLQRNSPLSCPLRRSQRAVALVWGPVKKDGAGAAGARALQRHRRHGTGPNSRLFLSAQHGG